MKIIRIEKVRASQDLNGILTIEQECFKEGFSGSVFYYFSELVPDSFVVAKTKEDVVVGYCLGINSQSNSSQAWVVSIAVHPKFRKIGIGTKLLQAVIKVIEKNAEVILLTVRPSNKMAIRFYQKHHFKISSNLPNLYGNESSRHIMKREKIK